VTATDPLNNHMQTNRRQVFRMKNSPCTRTSGPARLWALLVACALLARTGNTQAAPTPLFTCPMNFGAGGFSSVGGLYMPSYPGISLDAATLQLFTFNPGTFSLTLTVRSNAYNGAVLGTATTTVTLDSSVSPATFPFPSLHIVHGSRVCFVVTVVSGPASFVYVLGGEL